MKRTFILNLLACLIAVGCQVGNIADTTISTDADAIVLGISLKQTRTSLGSKVNDSYPVYWSENDKIVVNGVQSSLANINPDNNAYAEFEFADGSISYPYNITYPYCASTTAEKAIVAFPAEQTYTEGTFSLGSAPMCGYVNNMGNKIILNHLASVMHLPIKASSSSVVLTKVIITSDKNIAGEFEVDCQNATISATESCSNTLTYNLPANFALSTTTTSDLFIALPAIEVGSCKVEFVTASGKSMTLNWTPKAPLTKGVVIEFQPVAFSEGVGLSLGVLIPYEDELELSYKKFAKKGELKIMSFNIHTGNDGSTGANSWPTRKVACAEMIRDQKPSIVGFQEAQFDSQWTYMKTELADTYNSYGVSRNTGEESGSGETMGVLYDKSIIELLESGTFWLSETPNTPSKGWGANYYRTATWIRFKYLPTNKEFFFINTHLDHQVSDARIGGMQLIADKFKKYKDTHPLFLTGDMNTTSDNEAMDSIEDFMYNTRDNAPAPLTDYATTFPNYGKSTSVKMIDHIYCSNNLRVLEYHTIVEKYNDIPYVSDHNPIYAIVKLP